MSDRRPQRYSLGFMFTSDLQTVVLIRKERPDWQKGKLNGVGGKVEPGELFIDSMVREFAEETGVRTIPSDWKMFAKLEDPVKFEAMVYAAASVKAMDVVSNADEGAIVRVSVPLVCSGDLATIESVPWLVMAARQRLLGAAGSPVKIVAHYTEAGQ